MLAVFVHTRLLLESSFSKAWPVLDWRIGLTRPAKLRFLRSDLLHLLPFPTADSLARCIGPADLLTQAGHEFGGKESRPKDSRHV